MSVIIRKRGSRRRYLSVHFPLLDSRGAFVPNDRRQLPDRRKPLHDINDLKAILSKIYSEWLVGEQRQEGLHFLGGHLGQVHAGSLAWRVMGVCQTSLHVSVRISPYRKQPPSWLTSATGLVEWSNFPISRSTRYSLAEYIKDLWICHHEILINYSYKLMNNSSSLIVLAVLGSSLIALALYYLRVSIKELFRGRYYREGQVRWISRLRLVKLLSTPKQERQKKCQ